MSRLERQKRGTVRVIGLHDDDGSFDRAFWQAIPPAERLEMVWDMVLEFHAWQGPDGNQLRLQRSVLHVEQRKR